MLPSLYIGFFFEFSAFFPVTLRQVAVVVLCHRPGYYSEDEGVCCTNIHSQLAKKAKELVRPYQKGDHPKDRPPIPAKPPRPSLSRSNRLPSSKLRVALANQ